MTQPDLDFTTHPKVRNTDPDTSRQAWWDNLPRAGTQRGRIYRELVACRPEGLTCHELCEATGIKQCSASTRIAELLSSPYVEDTGERREGPDGSMQRVVRAVVR